MRNKHLTLEDRCIIEALLKNKITQKTIAEIVKCNPSTISRELKRKVNWIYSWKEAHRNYLNKRRFSKYQCMKINSNVELSNYIKSKLKKKDENLSPKIIANSWNEKLNNITITAPTIYKWLKSSMWNEYRKYLLYKKWYKKIKNQNKWKIKGRVSIDERNKNKFIEHRLEKWHFEADLIVSKKGFKWAVLTLIDRKTRFSSAFKIESKNSENIMKLIASIKDTIWMKSVTFDNWMEFSKHSLLNVNWVKTYFSDPYSPWQKWSIENFNRILRRTFPKWTNFNEISQEQIKSAIDIINNTPREILGFISPKKAHNM